MVAAARAEGRLEARLRLAVVDPRTVQDKDRCADAVLDVVDRDVADPTLHRANLVLHSALLRRVAVKSCT